MLRLFLDRFNFLFLKVLVSSFTLIGYISISYDLSLSEQRSGYESIIITANSLTVDNETKIAIFEGSVKAVKGDITLYADKMTVHYQNEKARRGIKKIDIEGNVKLIKKGRVVVSRFAEYNDLDEIIIFTGDPKATDGKNVMTGTKMTYFLKEDRYRIENTKVFLEHSSFKTK